MNPTSRRQFLQTAAGGIGGLALTSMLARGAQPHHTAKAKRVIQIFCPGGLSHVDTFDYKPELIKRAGKPFDPDGKLQFFASKPGNCQPSYYPFKQHGECGRWVSDLFPKLATHVDDMAFIYSMQSKTALHGPGCFMMNTGQTLPGFPSMGAWVTYGLGSESDNLPAFVVLPDPRGLPPGGPINWGAGFLPAVHQATTLDATNTEQPIADLFPPKDFSGTGRVQDQQTLAFLQKLNRQHAAQRTANTELDARIAAYEMAARLQLSAPEVTNLSGETELTKQLYAIDDPEDIGPFGRQCLMARRLAERGVRFMQIYCGAENTTAKKIRPNWDSHEDLVRDHGYWGAVLDTGASRVACRSEITRPARGHARHLHHRIRPPARRARQRQRPRSQRRCLHRLDGRRRHPRRHRLRQHRRTRLQSRRKHHPQLRTPRHRAASARH
jgi:hypothetical protein